MGSFLLPLQGKRLKFFKYHFFNSLLKNNLDCSRSWYDDLNFKLVLMVYKKRHYGLNALSKFLPEEAKKNLKKRGFFELELLKSWREIIGEDYYKLTKPNKIKKSQVSLRDTSTLQLKVDPTIAFAIEHDQTKIISKINGFFGYKAINKLEIIQERIDIDALRSNNNNKLNEEVNIDSNRFDKLSDYPGLQTSFQKILNKVKKS